MKHNHSGRSFGPTLIVILIAALLVALLVTGQMQRLGLGAQPQANPTQSPVQQAQGVADALNEINRRTLEIGQ